MENLKNVKLLNKLNKIFSPSQIKVIKQEII